MNFDNWNFVCVLLVMCFGRVQNKIKSSNNNDISDPNSEIYLDSLQLIAKSGIIPQRHVVVTEDGYTVNLFRLPNKGPVALLVHGIGDSSDSWLVTDRGSSLAYQLHDLGYDVWLYNARGNKYSKGHIMNLPDRKYWDFSYEEMGYYDMPAVIDYVLSITNQQKLQYVGFSQGTTIFFIMCSLRPEYNEKIKHAVLLAPVAWLNHLRYPFIKIFAKNSDFFKFLFDSIGVYKLFENNLLLKIFHAKVCREGVPENIFCQLEYALSYGIRNLTNLNIEKLPVISSHIPAGVSTRTFVHFFQMYSSERFQRYDFGSRKNLALYSSRRPPEYEVASVTVPVTIFTSESDWFSTVEDVKRLRLKLPNIVKFIQFNKTLDFTHLEFVYGSRVKTFVNDVVVNVLLNDFYS